LSLNGNDEKSYVGRVTTLAGLISDGLFVDGDWVETKDQDPNGEVRLIQLADIGDGTFRDRSSRYLTLAKARELRCTFLEPGDILIARMPQPLGRACLFPGVGQPAVTAVDVCIVRPNSRRVHPGWLVGMINAPQFRLAMTQFVRGTTRQRISRTNLGRLTMPVPELNEQAAIARQLEKIKARDVSIAERLAAARGIVDRIRGAVLAAACSGRLTAGWRADHPDELVGDIARALERRRVEARKFVQATLNFHATFDDLPESWRVVPLGLVVTDLQYGTSKRSAYDTRGTAVLRIPNVSSGVVTTDD
jgi:type I restriction enzyme S subunit